MDEREVDIGLVEPAMEQHMFHRLFDEIERANDEHTDSGLKGQGLTDYCHKVLCGIYLNHVSSNESDRNAELATLIRRRMYWVILTYFVQAHQGHLPEGTRAVMGSLYYREKYIG